MTNMKNKMISLTDELDSFLSTIPNASEYIREAIELKMGKTTQTLEAIEVDIQKHHNIIEKLEREYNQLIDQQLEHQEQLKLSEIKALEEKKRLKEAEERAFMDKWKPVLSNYPELLELDINDGVKLRSVCEEMIKKDIRIPPSSLRRYIVAILKK